MHIRKDLTQKTKSPKSALIALDLFKNIYYSVIGQYLQDLFIGCF